MQLKDAMFAGDILKGFVEGEAIVRATVIRRQQLGRRPPPVVRERVVKLKP